MRRRDQRLDTVGYIKYITFFSCLHIKQKHPKVKNACFKFKKIYVYAFFAVCLEDTSNNV